MNGPEKPGDVGDPVADAIRREQQLDAMPAPEQVRREHREMLAERGCHACGEDDPDELELEMKSHSDCPAEQTPPGPPLDRVVCEDHAVGGDEWRRRDITERLEDSDVCVAVAWYDCGGIQFITEPEPEHPPEAVPPEHREQASADIRCKCGAGLDTVQFPESEG